jgi:hydrogenase maturation protease
MSDGKSILVIGMGNPYRCDDGIGLQIAKNLSKILPEEVKVQTHTNDALALMELWQKYDCVYLIDAVSAGLRCDPNGSHDEEQVPVRLYRFDAAVEQLPPIFFTKYSTHSFSIQETIALCKNLGTLPKKLIIYGIEGHSFHVGTELSGKVQQAISDITDCIKKEIEDSL